MIDSVVQLWEEKKSQLEDLISKTPQSDLSYLWFVTEISKVILGYGDPIVHEIDDGHYQGTLIYLIVNDRIYQPGVDDYYFTSVYYGSCSGCDTLEAIRVYESGTPNEEQLDQYMMLCLHLIQGMKKLGE